MNKVIALSVAGIIFIGFWFWIIWSVGKSKEKDK